MGEKSQYRGQIAELLDKAVAAGNSEGVATFLRAHSNLPGPRGNLELAEAFAWVIEETAAHAPTEVWHLCLKLAATDPERAPVNDPGEFVVFCGIRGLGAVAVSDKQRYADAMAYLKDAATDPRWRAREAVAMALQDLIASHGMQVLTDLAAWVQGADWLAMRAVAAGVAEPRLLKDAAVAQAALDLHRLILYRFEAGGTDRSDAFRALRQGLGYSLSVIVAALPAVGWSYMRELAATRNEQIEWVLRENLKKTRLLRNFPTEVQDVRGRISS